MKTSEQDFLYYANLFALYHHEKWDGSGYPYGIRGDNISLPARLLAIIDVYDALISERPYKKALSHEDAIQIIMNGHGTHFDTVITELFFSVSAQLIVCETAEMTLRAVATPASPVYTIVMTRGILIAGSESALTSAIEVEVAKRVERYILASLPDRLSGDTAKDGLQSRWDNASVASVEKRISLEWNPGSPISARTLVLAAENRLEQINEAILVCDPPSIRCAVTNLSMTNVEVMVNDQIKSWFFLIKELATIFKARESGLLVLVYPETTGAGSKDDAADLLGSAALAAFRSLARSLLVAAFSEPYLTLGFSGAETGDDAGFAAFIFKQLDEENRRSNGKLYKYGKLGFFR